VSRCNKSALKKKKDDGLFSKGQKDSCIQALREGDIKRRNKGVTIIYV
jgi:hypothetical protein